MPLPSLQFGVPVNKLLPTGGRDSVKVAGCLFPDDIDDAGGVPRPPERRIRLPKKSPFGTLKELVLAISSISKRKNKLFRPLYLSDICAGKWEGVTSILK